MFCEFCLFLLNFEKDFEEGKGGRIGIRIEKESIWLIQLLMKKQLKLGINCIFDLIKKIKGKSFGVLTPRFV